MRKAHLIWSGRGEEERTACGLRVTRMRREKCHPLAELEQVDCVKCLHEADLREELPEPEAVEPMLAQFAPGPARPGLISRAWRWFKGLFSR